MESYLDAQEHESCAKRLKLGLDDTNISELCNGEGFSCFSTSSAGPNDISEGTSADCDSGYEASTLESIPISSHHISSPLQPEYNTESMSNITETFLQTNQLDTSQDSLGVEEDDDVSTVSELSGLSDLSGQEWRTMTGSMIWVQQQMEKGVNPRILLSDLGIDYDQIPDYVDDITIWKIIINMLAEPPRRNKLRHVNTLDDVIRLLKGAQRIIVLTGAGVSVSCGIPDFRSRDGIYSRLAIDFPNLPDPQAMFDISYFTQDPRPFFKFARDIYPGKFQPSPCHRFIKLLEKHKKLLRNYTQNIDTLEKEAEIDRVIECHGSFATATCTKCGYKVTADKIRDTVLSQKIPLCEKCHQGRESSVFTDDLTSLPDGRDYSNLVHSGIMKPDIVFFGEGLPDTFHEAMAADKSECDLLLVIGSSLKVRPVALIPNSLPGHVPQILINREPLPQCHFDVELLGDCDVIINHLCRILGNSWEEGNYSSQNLQQASTLLPLKDLPSPDINDSDNEARSKLEKNECICNKSTNTSSLNSKKDVDCIKCTSLENKSIKSDGDGEYETKLGKERHMSIDSARDSGIGENSNFTDKYDESDENCDEKTSSFCLEISNNPSTSSETPARTDISDLRGYWQPKVRKSLADRLPENSFHLIPPSRYIFPGAEVFYDPDEKLHYEDDLSSSDDSESESESESQNDSF